MAGSAGATPSSSAVRALALELKGLQDDPLEGIRSRLVNEDNMFEWEVALFGPPDTLYQGGYFKVRKKSNGLFKVSKQLFQIKSAKIHIKPNLGLLLGNIIITLMAKSLLPGSEINYITRLWSPQKGCASVFL